MVQGITKKAMDKIFKGVWKISFKSAVIRNNGVPSVVRIEGGKDTIQYVIARLPVKKDKRKLEEFFRPGIEVIVNEDIQYGYFKIYLTSNTTEEIQVI